jgi:hypothetical protein
VDHVPPRSTFGGREKLSGAPPKGKPRRAIAVQGGVLGPMSSANQTWGRADDYTAANTSWLGACLSLNFSQTRPLQKTKARNTSAKPISAAMRAAFGIPNHTQ